MSATNEIRGRIQKIRRGQPFTNTRFLRFGSRAAVDKTMSRLVQEGSIRRIARGVFFRPKQSSFIENVTPSIESVINVIAKDNGEVLQLHGAEAARRFKISTQMPIKPVYYTTGPAREILIGKIKVKLVHVCSQRKFQHVGKKTGLALTALWYLGKDVVNTETIRCIREGLSAEEFASFCTVSMPEWMKQVLEAYHKETNND